MFRAWEEQDDAAESFENPNQNVLLLFVLFDLRKEKYFL